MANLVKWQGRNYRLVYESETCYFLESLGWIFDVRKFFQVRKEECTLEDSTNQTQGGTHG